MLLAVALLAALSGPVHCRYIVPSDMPAGASEWVGPCAGDYASGVGVLRVAPPNGKVQLFFGQFKQGQPVRGIFGDTEGLSNPVKSFDPTTHHSIDDNATSHPSGQDASLWVLATEAARVAARHYEAIGNKASASFYRARAKETSRGPAQ